MPKSAQVTDEDKALAVPIDPASILDPNAFASVLAEYGVTAATSYVPEPPTVLKQNFDELCEFKTPVKDSHGNLFEDVIGHTGPLMFLAKEAEYDGEKFKDYDGFYVYAMLHPTKGKIVVTIGRPANGDKPAIVRFMDTLKAGAWIQVAAFQTSHGFRVFNPIPVQ